MELAFYSLHVQQVIHEALKDGLDVFDVFPTGFGKDIYIYLDSDVIKTHVIDGHMVSVTSPFCQWRKAKHRQVRKSGG